MHGGVERNIIRFSTEIMEFRIGKKSKSNKKESGPLRALSYAQKGSFIDILNGIHADIAI